MTLLIGMLINSKHVYFLHKFDVGKTRQNVHVTLKSNVELKRQSAATPGRQTREIANAT